MEGSKLTSSRGQSQSRAAEDACESSDGALSTQCPMSEVPDEWSFLETGWRVAYALTGCREGASKVFKDTLEEVLRHPGAGGDAAHTRILFFTVLRHRSLKFAARCDLTGLPADLHRLPEPGRSAYTFLLLDALSGAEIQNVLGLKEREVADYVQSARSSLQKSTEASA